MSLHYLLDGYNITKQIPALARKNLKGERESLVRLVENYKPQGSQRNRVTVVFDGQEGIVHSQKKSALKIVFSQNESGDEKIRRIVKGAPNKRNIVVVTDDKELRFSIRALGARLQSVKDFLAKLDIYPGQEKKKKAIIREDKKKIPLSLEYKITQELESIWLVKGRKS